MLRNYNSFTLLLESKKRDKKLEKQRQKIHKFLTYEPIIDYVFDRIVSNDSTKGLQYTIWFADKIKKDFIDYIIALRPSEIIDKLIEDNNIKDIDNIGDDVIEKYVNDFLSGKKKVKDLKKIIDKIFKRYIDRKSDDISKIVDWLKSPIREEETVNLDQYTHLQSAVDRAEEWHNEIKSTGVIVKESGTVLMTFDDGYYWIDLETNSCRDEANAMGHCGTTEYGDTLYSLRKKQSPHVTSAIGEDGVVYQMKGRNNKKPTEKYHPYILELLKYPNNSDNVKIINDFDKITSFSTVEYLSEEDFHITDLNSKNIKDLMKSNKELIDNEGIGLKYKLMKLGEITKEDVISGYKDLRIIDDEIILIVDGWVAFEEDIFEEDRNYRKGWQRSVIDGTYGEDLFYDTIKFDFTYEWDKLEERVFKELLEVLEDKKYLIEYYDDDEDKEFTISTKNTSLSPKKDDLWIKTPIGGVLSFKNLLEDSSSEIKTNKGEIEFNTEWDELTDIFNFAYTNAQKYADLSEAYDTVTGSIENVIGDLVKNGKNYWWYEEDEKGEKRGYLHFKLNIDFITKLDNALDENYSSIIDMINDIPNVGDVYSNNEFLIECDVPYYGWSGSIDGSDLSEEIIYKLDEL